MQDPRLFLALYPFLLMGFVALMFFCQWIGDRWQEAADRRATRKTPQE